MTKVPVWKNTIRSIKTLMMLICPECHRSFMQEQAIITYRLSEYKAKHRPLEPEIQQKIAALQPQPKPKKIKEGNSQPAYTITTSNKARMPKQFPKADSEEALQKLKKQQIIYDHRYGWIKNPYYEKE